MLADTEARYIQTLVTEEIIVEAKKSVNSERVGLTGRSIGIMKELIARRKYSEWERGGTGVSTTVYQVDLHGERNGDVTYCATRTKTIPQPMGEFITELASCTGRDWLRSVQWLVKSLDSELKLAWERPTQAAQCERASCPFCGETNTRFIFNSEKPKHCEHFVGQKEDHFVFACDDPEIIACPTWNCDAYITGGDTCPSCGLREYDGPETTAEARGEA